MGRRRPYWLADANEKLSSELGKALAQYPLKKIGSEQFWLCSSALLQQYFSANEQYFSLITNQYKHQHKPNEGIYGCGFES